MINTPDVVQRLSALLLRTLVILLGGFTGLIHASSVNFFVSPAGDDVSGNGSKGNPWRSITAARDHIRAAGLNTNMQGEITVYLRGGRYSLSETLDFTSADSGANGYYITYQSYSNEIATISGGRQVAGWGPVAGRPYWVASVPTNLFGDYFRQIYVNGIRAERAHSDWITNAGLFNDPATPQPVDGVTFNASNFKSYSHITDLRMLRIGNFKVDEFPVTGISTNATNGLIQVELQQPYCQMRYDYGRGPTDLNSLSFTNQWMVIQALEDLDEPGEWYLDRANHKVYYYPFSYEDMTTAQVYAPVVETLVRFAGRSPTNKVQNIRLQNLVFEHGNWLFPRDYFIGGAQAEILFAGVPTNSVHLQYGFEMPGEIVLKQTKSLQFIGNIIRHMGSCGIQLYNGARETLIQGNIFFDLTGAAVLGGRWGGDTAISNQEICTNTLVVDNVIRNTGADFMAATSIDNLQHYLFRAIHNDIADSQYMGFHQRTSAEQLADSSGIGGTEVAFNRVSLINTGQRYGVGDGGFIYSFGVWPDSTFQGNDLNVIDAPSGEMRGMMFDNNSYGLTGISNVVRNAKAGLNGYFLYTSLPGYLNFSIENYGDATRNSFRGVSNIDFHKFTGPLPVTARAIVDNAGLERGYTKLLRFIYAGTNLAQGRFTWASSQSSKDQFPGAAVDWDYATIWQPAANDTNNCWWAVDLGATYVIQRIEIATPIDLNEPDARCNFQVQGANDSGFTNMTVLAEQGRVPFAYKANFRGKRFACSWIKYVNNSQRFRYLRVIKTASGTLHFSEFKAFGYIAGVTTTRTTTINRISPLFR